MYAKHEAIGETTATGADGLGIAAPRDGTTEIDDLLIFSVKKDAVQPGWEATKKKLPIYKPVTLETKGNKKAK